MISGLLYVHKCILSDNNRTSISPLHPVTPETFSILSQQSSWCCYLHSWCSCSSRNLLLNTPTWPVLPALPIVEPSRSPAAFLVHLKPRFLNSPEPLSNMDTFLKLSGLNSCPSRPPPLSTPPCTFPLFVFACLILGRVAVFGYNIVLVSHRQQSESAIDIQYIPHCWVSLPPSRHPLPSLPSRSSQIERSSCVIQQVPTSSLSSVLHMVMSVCQA